MVLGKLPVPGSPTIWITVVQGLQAFRIMTATTLTFCKTPSADSLTFKSAGVKNSS